METSREFDQNTEQINQKRELYRMLLKNLEVLNIFFTTKTLKVLEISKVLLAELVKRIPHFACRNKLQ